MRVIIPSNTTGMCTYHLSSSVSLHILFHMNENENIGGCYEVEMEVGVNGEGEGGGWGGGA